MVNLLLGDVVQFRVIGKDEQGGEWINTFYFATIANPVGTITDEEAAQQLDASLAPLYKLSLPNLATYDGIQARIINRTPLTAAVSTIANTGIGTGGADQAPSQATALISWQTSFAGRKFRGRSYIGPLSTTQLNNGGRLTAGGVTMVENIAAAVIGTSSFSSGGNSILCELVLHHKDPLQSPDEIVSSIVTTRIATQRRRGSFGKNRQPPI